MSDITDADRLALKPGDRVRVRLDSGQVDEFEVKYAPWAPWALGHGTLVIGLRGIAGGYLLSRVVGIVATRRPP